MRLRRNFVFVIFSYFLGGNSLGSNSVRVDVDY